jgi:dodecin
MHSVFFFEFCFTELSTDRKCGGDVSRRREEVDDRSSLAIAWLHASRPRMRGHEVGTCGSPQEVAMAIVKVIEVLAESDASWDEAVKKAVVEASRTVRNIKSVYVKEFQAMVEGDKIRTFRVNAKISFVIDKS